MNDSIDQNLDLINTPSNNRIVDEYIEYLVANLSSASALVDGEMDDPENPGTDKVASCDVIGSGQLAGLFPAGPAAFVNMMFYADKTSIENNGVDDAALTVILTNAAGQSIDDGTVIHLSLVSGEGILSETTPTTMNGQAIVNVISVWPGDIVVEASQELSNGNTIRSQIKITVTDLEEDVADAMLPGLVSAGSISNTEVLVTFNKPMSGGLDGAENPDYYHIVSFDGDTGIPGRATLTVKRAELLLPERDTVRLTTLSQSDIEYTPTVTNVRDLAGNPIAQPGQGTDPSSANFFGRPSVDPVDTDEDQLTDSQEIN